MAAAKRKESRKEVDSRQSTVRHYAQALPGCVLDKLAAPSFPLSLSRYKQYSKTNIKYKNENFT